MKRTVIAAALVLAAVACKKDPAKEEAARIDRDVASELAEGPDKHAEAREWLARPSAMGFKVSVKEMSEITEAIYAAGAPRVHVTGISKLGDRELAAVLVAELPEGADQRKPIFDWYAKWAATTEEKPVPDVGQKYLKVILD